MTTKYFVCINCEQPTSKLTKYKSSFAIEIALWLFGFIFCIAAGWFVLIIPILFTVYRTFFTSRACEHCGSTNLIPMNSVKGKKIMTEYIRQQEQ